MHLVYAIRANTTQCGGVVCVRATCRLDGRSLAQGDVHPTTLNAFDNQPGGRTGGELSAHSAVVDTDGRAVPMRYGEVLTPLHTAQHRTPVSSATRTQCPAQPASQPAKGPWRDCFVIACANQSAGVLRNSIF